MGFLGISSVILNDVVRYNITSQKNFIKGLQKGGCALWRSEPRRVIHWSETMQPERSQDITSNWIIFLFVSSEQLYYILIVQIM